MARQILFLVISLSKYGSVFGQQFGAMGMGMGGGTSMGGGGSGTCTFDPNCYLYSPTCTLANGYPFIRRFQLSCEDCLSECQKKNSGNGSQSMLMCASVVYDAIYQTCDIFAVTAAPPQRLMKYPGRMYLQPTGASGCGAQTPIALCKNGETSKIIAVKGYQIDGFSGQDVTGLDENGCAQACLTGKLPDGSSFECHSAQFHGGTCTVSKETKKAEGSLKKGDGTFYQQLCLPSDLVKNCPDIFYEAPQKILVGQNTQTIDVGSISDCVRACLESPKKRGFVCTSGIYYYKENKYNCILNVENSKTKPDLFVDENQDTETYFELLCGTNGSSKSFARKSFKEAFNDLPEEGEWAYWSDCKGRTSKQIRFRQCRKMHSRDCPSEERSCDPRASIDTPVTPQPAKKKSGDENLVSDQSKARDAVSRGECRAAIINGKKNCRIGQMINGGKKELCMHPIDC